MTISTAGGSGLAALGEGRVGMGPPSPQCPPKNSPLPSSGGEESGLGHTGEFVSFFIILAPIHVAGSR